MFRKRKRKKRKTTNLHLKKLNTYIYNNLIIIFKISRYYKKKKDPFIVAPFNN